MSGHQWAQGLVALAIWIGISLGVGIYRLTQRDLAS
jgi:hypothetical protein